MAATSGCWTNGGGTLLDEVARARDTVDREGEGRDKEEEVGLQRVHQAIYARSPDDGNYMRRSHPG